MLLHISSPKGIFPRALTISLVLTALLLALPGHAAAHEGDEGYVGSADPATLEQVEALTNSLNIQVPAQAINTHSFVAPASLKPSAETISLAKQRAVLM